MDNSLIITEVEKPQKRLNICMVPNGTVVQFENGRIGLAALGGFVQLTNNDGVRDFEVFNKTTMAPYKKRLGKLVGITIQKE